MKGDQPNGYTVLELMIVIAVSASMFVAVAIAFGGRQQQIQFTQAVRDLDARILDIVNDVSTGYYDNTGTLGCSVASDSAARPVPNGNAAPIDIDAQGSSDDCVFIGKAIQFAPLTYEASGSPQPDVINVYNIVGRRNNNGSVNSLNDARPVAVAPTSYPDTMNLDSQVLKIPLDWGLKITDIYDNALPPNNYGTIGFFTSFVKSFSTPTEDVNISNNQSVKYGAIPTTTLNEAPFEAVAKINSITDFCGAVFPEIYVDTDNNVIPACDEPRVITICLKSADDNRRAAIVIGADGTTATKIQFDDYDITKCIG